MTTDASRRRLRLKYCAHIEMGQSPPSTEYSSSPEDGLPFLQGTADFGTVSPTPYVYCGSPTKLARAGDILFSVRAPVGEINLADQEFGIGRGLCAIRPQRHWNARFLWWALHEARHQLNFVSTGSTYDAVAAEDVGSLLVETTALVSQRAIADYLDRETTRLDALVTEKERLLDLLAEKHRALLTRAVTRGLDANVPLRDSGIPWLEKIPAHWETRRLKFLSPQITVGIVVTPAKYYEITGIPCLRSLNVREHGLSDADLVFISEENNLLHSKSIIRVGDLVAVRSGQPGTTAVVDQRFDGANCIDLIIIRRSHHIDSAFLTHFLNSEPAKMQFLSGSGGAIQQHFNIETAAGLLVPLPPLQEQCDIVVAVAKATSKVDALSTATRRTIALLRERRSALTAGVLTGHIDIGNVA